MPNNKVQLLYPTVLPSGGVLPPGWYDVGEIPESAIKAEFVYYPPGYHPLATGSHSSQGHDAEPGSDSPDKRKAPKP